MLEARNARRERPRRGSARRRCRAARPHGAATDPELREEVRTLVEARNARRAARGEEPLDVEAEVDRQPARARRRGVSDRPPAPLALRPSGVSQALGPAAWTADVVIDVGTIAGLAVALALHAGAVVALAAWALRRTA